MKRIFRLSLCFLCLTLLCTPARSASPALEKELQALKDAGIPTSIEELVPPDLPDSENGALIYRQAFTLKDQLQKKYPEEWQYLPYEGTIVWEKVPAAQKEKISRLVLENPDFIAFYQLLGKAAAMPTRFLTREDYQKGASMTLPHLAQLRSCARLLAAKSLIEAEHNQISQALKTSLIGLKMANETFSGEPILISQLVRIAAVNMLIINLQQVTKKGAGNAADYAQSLKEIARNNQSRLIADGLKCELVVFGLVEFPRLRKAGTVEQAEPFFQSVIDAADPDSQSVIDQLSRKFQAGPEEFWDEEEIFYLQTMRQFISFVSEPYWKTKQERLEALENDLIRQPGDKGIFTRLVVPAVRGAYRNETRSKALLGAAEIGLADRMYKLKHGVYADSLVRLTPEILPELPLDPFTGRNYIYRKTGAGFIVYSVGENLKDENGKPPASGKPTEGDIVWEDN